MADLQYNDHIEVLRQWLKDTADNMLKSPDQRDWCLFNLDTDFTSASIDDYFTTKQVNEDFAAEAKKEDVTGVPVAHLQLENDHIFAINKMMVYRHQPRLKFYRDDLENKDVRTRTSVAISLAKFQLLKDVVQGT